MRIILQNEWRNRAIFVAIIIMLISLFVSRTFLSASIIAFLALTIIHKNVFSQLDCFIKSPLLMVMSFLFFIPFVSGLWSSHEDEWAGVVRVKLPFLFLPLAFAGNWQLPEKQWKLIGYCFLLLITMGCCWSLWHYFQNIQAVNDSYLRAKTLSTPLQDDHVRFSWLVSIAIVCATLLITLTKNKRERSLLVLFLLLFVIYLHILSVRTGLIAIYLFFLCLAAYLAVQGKKIFVIILAGLVAVALISWFLFPTLKNRFRYIVYDFSFLRKDSIEPGTSDANRLISIKAGWHILRENPWGVGAGDVKYETRQWYATHIPNITETNKLFPSSEWIIHGDMAGWAGVLLFTFIVGVPFFIQRISHRFFWIMLLGMATGNLLLEPALEVQFGIFIYCFTILWWWKWLKFQNR